MRKGSLIQLILFGVIAAAITVCVAVFIPWMPDWAGKEGQRIGFVFWFTTAIAIGVFSLVASVIAYSVWKFRAPAEDDSDGPPIHGNSRLEIVWTAVPIMLVFSIAIVSAVVLAQNSRAGSDPLVVKVTGQQFAWTFTYPDGKTYGTLRLPVNRHTKLEVTAKEDDVIHSFWVPEFGQKQDAVPGAVNPLVVTPTRTGTFDVICTELCGLGHSLMRTHAIVMTQPKFTAWMKGGTSGAAKGGGAATSALATFTKNGCSSCHTLSAAGSTAKVGPDLDNLPQYAKRAGQPLEQFVHESIVDPGAYVEPSYQDIMPHTFQQQISPTDLTQLVHFLVKESQKS